MFEFWNENFILTDNCIISFIITYGYNVVSRDGRLRHYSSEAQNLKHRLLLNYNILYTLWPNKNITVFVTPLNTYSYLSSTYTAQLLFSGVQYRVRKNSKGFFKLNLVGFSWIQIGFNKQFNVFLYFYFYAIEIYYKY